MKANIKVKLHKKIEPRKKNSFWFDGHVATVTDGKNSINIISMGHVCVSFEPNGDLYKNDDARKVAKKRGYTDIKLNNLSKHDGWSNNNWFSFEVVKEGKLPVWNDLTEINIDDAIEIAKDALVNL